MDDYIGGTFTLPGEVEEFALSDDGQTYTFSKLGVGGRSTSTIKGKKIAVFVFHNEYLPLTKTPVNMFEGLLDSHDDATKQK